MGCKARFHHCSDNRRRDNIGRGEKNRREDDVTEDRAGCLLLIELTHKHSRQPALKKKAPESCRGTGVRRVKSGRGEKMEETPRSPEKPPGERKKKPPLLIELITKTGGASGAE